MPLTNDDHLLTEAQLAECRLAKRYCQYPRSMEHPEIACGWCVELRTLVGEGMWGLRCRNHGMVPFAMTEVDWSQ